MLPIQMVILVFLCINTHTRFILGWIFSFSIYFVLSKTFVEIEFENQIIDKKHNNINIILIMYDNDEPAIEENLQIQNQLKYNLQRYFKPKNKNYAIELNFYLNF